LFGAQRPIGERVPRCLRATEALAYVTHCEMAKLTPHERQAVDETANRCRLMLAINARLARAKALPAPSASRIPSGKELAALLKRG